MFTTNDTDARRRAHDLTYACFLPLGVYRTLGFRHDAVLWLLSAATILMVFQLFAELGPVQVQNLAWLSYGALVFALQASWFLARRRRAYPR